MEAVRQQQLVSELSQYLPGLAQKAGGQHLTASDLDAFDALLDSHRKVMASHQVLQAEARRQAHEYTVLAEQRQADNEAHGVGLASLPPDAQQDVALVVAAALGLGVNSTRMDALHVASSARMMEAMKEAKQQRAAGQVVSELRATLAALQAQSSSLEQQLAAAQAQQDRQVGTQARTTQTELEFYKTKKEQYATSHADIQKRLAAQGFVRELSHSELVSQGALVSSLESQLAAVKQELCAYQDVPPSLSGMQALLQRTLADLADKQQQFDRKVLRADY